MIEDAHEVSEACEMLLKHHSAVQSPIIKGVSMSTGSSFFRSPLLWFVVGAAAGFYGYKHRKEFAAALAKAGDMGRDFAQQQRENLEDLLEEAREAEEAGESVSDESAEPNAK
jgi:hypothetical protein